MFAARSKAQNAYCQRKAPLVAVGELSHSAMPSACLGPSYSTGSPLNRRKEMCCRDVRILPHDTSSHKVFERRIRLHLPPDRWTVCHSAMLPSGIDGLILLGQSRLRSRINLAPRSLAAHLETLMLAYHQCQPFCAALASIVLAPSIPDGTRSWHLTVVQACLGLCALACAQPTSCRPRFAMHPRLGCTAAPAVDSDHTKACSDFNASRLPPVTSTTCCPVFLTLA